MPRDLVPKREGPKEEISTPVEPHNRGFADRPVREQNADEARAAARSRTQADAWKHDFANAKLRLSKMTYAQSVDFIQSMPVGVQELYLLAEEDSRNREEVLRFFPKPGTRARSRWLPESLAPVGA